MTIYSLKRHIELLCVLSDRSTSENPLYSRRIYVMRNQLNALSHSQTDNPLPDPENRKTAESGMV